MWNHPQNQLKDPESSRVPLISNSLKEKVEKSLDLTIYLNYLQNLFSQSTSDSDSSDVDFQLEIENEIGNPIESDQNVLQSLSTTNNDNFSNSSASTLQSSNQDSSYESSDSSSLDENDILMDKMIPMTDQELQNLMEAHNLWKKNQYSIGSDADVASILNACGHDSEGKRKKGKKPKKQSKKKKGGVSEKSLGDLPSADNSSVGFGGDTMSDVVANSLSSNSIKSGKGRSRKQSLKYVRSEESIAAAAAAAAAASSAAVSTATLTASSSISSEIPDSSTVHSNISESIVRLASEIEVKQEIDCLNADEIVDNVNVANTPVMPANVGLIESAPETFHAFTPEDEDEDTNENSLSAGLNINSISMDDDDDDDNDSLKDYLSMAATAAATPTPASLIAQSQAFLKGKRTAGSDAVVAVPSPGVVSGSSNSTSSFDIKKRKGDSKEASPKQRKGLSQKTAKTIEALNLKRRRIYVLLCKKEIGKTQRALMNNHKESLVTKRRLAHACTRLLRQKAIQSQKIMKESVWRAKRLTREMQAHWKQADRIEREIRRRKEKEAEEQRKFDLELLEAKRQQRKLNFLITQTELYAHFMSKKLGRKEGDETVILNQLNETKDERLVRIDDYDSEAMKNKAKMNVKSAFLSQQTQVCTFDMDLQDRRDFREDEILEMEGDAREFTQPKMFNGVLKHYQLKGMNWLISLYDQAINGILSDEMGLGKTCQSIAFLAHVAERYNVWGPFLVIAPASTLHNWQQEFKRFVPTFKVIPYWGNPQERKILRQLWQQSNLHTEASSFHTVVTSYQIVVTDLKYFNRVKWQYLILDEAQAIKSTSSARWKMLLGFSCRNRLLLTGTPIQNTMGELWALLHFIMPSLFDSHEEFSEWFSKDIESHAENKSTMDERHLSRLHLILKPFMLRRIKKDVENELSDKIEVLVYCPLTSRQRLLYAMLKKKIRIDDLLKSAGSANSQLSQHATTNLMNLVMQFRKVCNHSDLFERREVKSPFQLGQIISSYPKIIFRDGLLHMAFPSKRHLTENRFSIFNPCHIFESLYPRDSNVNRRFLYDDVNADIPFSEWSFLRFIKMSMSELSSIVYGGMLERWKHMLGVLKDSNLIHLQRFWEQKDNNTNILLRNEAFLLYPERISSWPNVQNSEVLNDLIFTSNTSSVYSFIDHTIYVTPETVEHRLYRSRKNFPTFENPPLVPEFPHIFKEPVIRSVQPTEIPPFLYYMCPNVVSKPRQLYFYDRSAAWWLLEHELCSTVEGLNCVLYGTPHIPSPTFSEPEVCGGLRALKPLHGWSQQILPGREKLITDSGKLTVLDGLLKRLKGQGHRVLIYSQMTRMIDLLEEYMWYCKWKYMRLDGSSKISERRDMVADFQTKSDIFVFLLSTRAGGLGINLTAADTVIFYDSDWNPTVDLQAADRIHRLGQTKQVTIYRLICKGTIEERILQRAQEKNEIQRMVISGGDFRSDTLKPKEVVSLLLDDEELEKKYRRKQAERKFTSESCSSEFASDMKPCSSSSKRKVSLKNSTSMDKEGLDRETWIKSEKELGNQPGESLTTSLISDDANQEGELPQCDETGYSNQDCDEYPEGEESSNEDAEGSRQGSSAILMSGNPSLDWNTDYNSDIDDDLATMLKKPKMGRGNGKRGRPPSRVRAPTRDVDGEAPLRRGPGRPRLRPIGPANQGIRGRRPGRPPLSKKAEGMGSSLTPLTASQRVFGFYSSPDVDFS